MGARLLPAGSGLRGLGCVVGGLAEGVRGWQEESSDGFAVFEVESLSSGAWWLTLLGYALAS